MANIALEGGNGKGLFSDLCYSMFGDFSYKFPPGCLCSTIKTGPNPELAGMRKKRFNISSEPDSDQWLFSNTIKELTGGTNISCSDLYSSNLKTKIKGMFFLECNDVPLIKIQKDINAIKRRCIIIPYLSSFKDESIYQKMKDNTDEYKEKIKKCDDDDQRSIFQRKIDKFDKYIKKANLYYKTEDFKVKYRQALFIILAKYYKNFRRNNKNIKVPAECVKRVDNYLKCSDSIYQWVLDNYEMTDNQKDKIKLKEIYFNFTLSEFYKNLTKAKKRQHNYKNYVETLRKNEHLSDQIAKNKEKVWVMLMIKRIQVSVQEDGDEDYSAYN